MRSIAERQDGLAEQLRGDELVPIDIAPERVVRWANLGVWASDSGIEDIDNPTKGIDSHLHSPFVAIDTDR
jgi:hypothetical protein